ncbi:Protein of unknown function (DUF4065) [Candidatus Methanophagaceae archaeon]|nr:Protein of unknown function (DUF4065) [Methanophagales archaeon]
MEREKEVVELADALENEVFNREKCKQFLHYIIHQCVHLDNVGKTVLFKLLYFSDFDYYELYEKKLSSESYRKIPLGPAPCHFDEVVEELENEDNIMQFTGQYGKYDQQKFLSQKRPDVCLLNGNEIQVIDDVILKYSHMNATQISEFSHRDMPYKATKDNDIIDYELVFYRDPLFSVREYEDD